tara:strand:+ start:162 stop:455 length:294 start_codon:yes stop_codon:yes gene_type:complete
MMPKRNLKHIGQKKRDYNERQNKDNEQMRVRALESAFGNGTRRKLIDLKEINWKHAEILRKFGYVKRMVNIGSIVLTEKAFTDWDTLCQERLFKRLD